MIRVVSFKSWVALLPPSSRRFSAAVRLPDTGLPHQLAGLWRTIAAMPAFTSAGLAGKRRFIRRAEFDDDEGIIAASNLPFMSPL